VSVVQHTEPLDLGPNYIYGAKATVDAGAVEIRGGDIDNENGHDVVVSVCFDPDDLPGIAKDILMNYEEKGDEQIAKSIAGLNDDPDLLLREAWRLIRAAEIVIEREDTLVESAG
jgi:hypothetical protein